MFVELGTDDILTSEEFKKKKPKAQYIVYDLTKECKEDKRKINHLLGGIVADMKRGKLDPLPLTVFPLRKARQAFKFMSEAGHIGKIVFKHPTELKFSGMVVLSGGFGGLGGAYSTWLLENKKVSGILKMGRSGAKEKEDAKSSKGFVIGARCDISKSQNVSVLIQEARKVGGSMVGGVFHLAGVVRDESFNNLEWKNLKTTVRPKIHGLFALRKAVKEDAKWVLFSSVASMIGTVGQSSYATANGFMDFLKTFVRL